MRRKSLRNRSLSRSSSKASKALIKSLPKRRRPKLRAESSYKIKSKSSLEVDPDSFLEVRPNDLVVVHRDSSMEVQPDRSVEVHSDNSLEVHSDSSMKVHSNTSLQVHSDSSLKVPSDSSLDERPESPPKRQRKSKSKSPSKSKAKAQLKHLPKAQSTPKLKSTRARTLPKSKSVQSEKLRKPQRVAKSKSIVETNSQLTSQPLAANQNLHNTRSKSQRMIQAQTLANAVPKGRAETLEKTKRKTVDAQAEPDKAKALQQRLMVVLDKNLPKSLSVVQSEELQKPHRKVEAKTLPKSKPPVEPDNQLKSQKTVEDKNLPKSESLVQSETLQKSHRTVKAKTVPKSKPPVEPDNQLKSQRAVEDKNLSKSQSLVQSEKLQNSHRTVEDKTLPKSKPPAKPDNQLKSQKTVADKNLSKSQRIAEAAKSRKSQQMIKASLANAVQKVQAEALQKTQREAIDGQAESDRVKALEQRILLLQHKLSELRKKNKTISEAPKDLSLIHTTKKNNEIKLYKAQALEAKRRRVPEVAQISTELFKFAGFDAIRQTPREYVYHLTCSREKKRENTYMIQILIENKVPSVGKYVLPPSVNMEKLKMEVPMAKEKHISDFLKTCRRYILCFNERQKQYKDVLALAEKRGKCSIQATMGLTQVIMDFIGTRNTRDNTHRNLRIKLFYFAKAIRPHTIFVEDMVGTEFEDADLRQLKKSVRVFKHHDMATAFNKIWTNKQGLFVWSLESEEVDSSSHDEDKDDSSSTAPPVKRRRSLSVQHKPVKKTKRTKRVNRK